MQIYIDNQEVDTDSTTRVNVRLSAAESLSPQWHRLCYASGVTIPATSRNRCVMGDAEQIHAVGTFNSERHTVRVEQQGATVAEGELYLRECTAGHGGRYKFDIVGEGTDWALETLGSLGDLPVEYAAALSAQTIADSWTAADAPVRFLPVERNRANDDAVPVVLPRMRFLTSSDYHPFLHVGTLVDAMFAQSGYTLVSKFFDSALFRSLYMSGRYAERDIAALVERMDFSAGRFTDSATAAADAAGRVYADPGSNYSTVGNIVETASSEAVDPSGNRVDEAFTFGRCFDVVDGRAVFTPKTTVSVGFCYRLAYDTGYRIRSRSRLTGFDTVFLHSGDRREFVIPNPFEDRRGETLSGTMQYRVVVFEHGSGAKYKLRARRKTTGGYVDVDLALFESRSTLFRYASTAALTSPALYCWNGTAYVVYSGDWAIYDGYVGETGTRSIDITVREAPAVHSPSSPKYFDTIWFGGAESGMNLTLKRATSVRPVFVPHPTECSTLHFADVTVGLPSQQKLLLALQQMFNLKFYTDAAERRVFVEPADDLYADGAEFDWRDRIDLSQPVSVEELGADFSRRTTFGYRSGDGTVDHLDAFDGEPFGDWSAEVAHRFAAKSDRRNENPLFTPSASCSRVMGNAPSAMLVCAGDRTAEPYDAESDDLNFPTKIVRYMGMSQLPAGEFWGWPSVADSYPLAAFHLPSDCGAEAFTLCFGDRDSLVGLHRYRDSDFERTNASRRIGASVRIYPEEMEELLHPNDRGRDLRATFRLRFDGEEVLCLLEEVCSYDPSLALARCKFITK